MELVPGFSKLLKSLSATVATPTFQSLVTGLGICQQANGGVDPGGRFGSRQALLLLPSSAERGTLVLGRRGVCPV